MRSSHADHDQYWYLVYGFWLRSAHEIPGLEKKNRPLSDADITLIECPTEDIPAVAWESQATFAEHDRSGASQFAVWQGNLDGACYYRLWVKSPNAETFLVLDANGTTVWLPAMEERFRSGIAALLLGTVMGAVARFRGQLCLHGSVIALNGHAIAILGHKGVGKSTLAGAFARQGAAVLADDLVILKEQEGSFIAHPAYPRLRLWPASVQALLGQTDNLPRVLSFQDKRYVELSRDSTMATWRFQEEALPLSALYILERSPTPLALPEISSLTRASSLMALVQHTYASAFPLDRKLQKDEFARLGRLASALPVMQIRRPDDLARLDQLHNMLHNHAATLTLI